jgi:hypothetical protein
MKPNQKILEALLKNALNRVNFSLLVLICQSYQTYQLAVNEGFLERMEKFLAEVRKKILAMVGITTVRLVTVHAVFLI